MRILTTKGKDLDMQKALKLHVRGLSNSYENGAVVIPFVDRRQQKL